MDDLTLCALTKGLNKKLDERVVALFKAIVEEGTEDQRGLFGCFIARYLLSFGIGVLCSAGLSRASINECVEDAWSRSVRIKDPEVSRPKGTAN